MWFSCKPSTPFKIKYWTSYREYIVVIILPSGKLNLNHLNMDIYIVPMRTNNTKQKDDKGWKDKDENLDSYKFL